MQLLFGAHRTCQLHLAGIPAVLMAVSCRVCCSGLPEAVGSSIVRCDFELVHMVLTGALGPFQQCECCILLHCSCNNLSFDSLHWC
jgi:hypothetical protein